MSGKFLLSNRRIIIRNLVQEILITGHRRRTIICTKVIKSQFKESKRFPLILRISTWRFWIRNIKVIFLFFNNYRHIVSLGENYNYCQIRKCDQKFQKQIQNVKIWKIENYQKQASNSSKQLKTFRLNQFHNKQNDAFNKKIFI